MFKIFQRHVITNQEPCRFGLDIILTQTPVDDCAGPVSYVTMATFERCGEIFVGDDKLEGKTVTSLRNTRSVDYSILFLFLYQKQTKMKQHHSEAKDCV